MKKKAKVKTVSVRYVLIKSAQDMVLGVWGVLAGDSPEAAGPGRS